MPTRLTLAAALLAAALLLCPRGAAAQSSAPPPGPERLLLDAANRERAARHLPALRWDASLARAARDHAQLMAQYGRISHQFPGEPGLSDRFTRAGVHSSVASENVGQARSAEELHRMWMHSSAHRANLLDPQVDSAGFALALRDGQYFAVEDFARVFISLSLDAQERQIGALLAARGLRLLPSSSDARATCALDRGVVDGLHPKYHVRWMAADLNQLPKQLTTELHSGKYHSAAVGACPAGSAAGVGAYRLVVLLY